MHIDGAVAVFERFAVTFNKLVDKVIGAVPFLQVLGSHAPSAYEVFLTQPVGWRDMWGRVVGFIVFTWNFVK